MNWGFKSILATIAVVIVAILLDQQLNSNSSSSHDDINTNTANTANTNTPGLDFGTGSMFDSIAERYDTINRVLALRMDIGWRSKMTNNIKDILLQIKQQQKDEKQDEKQDEGNGWKILDIATGTADVALQLIQDLSSTASSSTITEYYDVTVLGLDPSENMLAVGRKKIKQRNLENQIILERADARDLSKYYINSDDSNESDDTSNTLFDAATIAFGIRNVVPNRNQALCEIYKLLKPKTGVIAILEFSQPTYQSNGVLGAAAGIFIQYVVPFVGGIMSGGARKEYIHLQNSIKEFPSPNTFNEQLQNLECPLLKKNNDNDQDYHLYTGYYDMQPVQNMNFGSVQLYIGRTAIKPKSLNLNKNINKNKQDPKLPPIGGSK
jgi:demethylmenaquinone methyltransferase/2-methoxy-6-polyprenyl-1,4-benzoquinol methylase